MPGLRALFLCHRTAEPVFHCEHPAAVQSRDLTHRFQVEVAGIPPVAAPQSETTAVALGSSVVIDGSASMSPEGRDLTYHWRLAAHPMGSETVVDQAGAQTSFVPDVAGGYRVELSVSDGELWNDEPASLTFNANWMAGEPLDADRLRHVLQDFDTLLAVANAAERGELLKLLKRIVFRGHDAEVTMELFSSVNLSAESSKFRAPWLRRRASNPRPGG